MDDIIFEPTEVQEIFYAQIYKTLEQPIVFGNKSRPKDRCVGVRKNPSEVRAILSRHFRNRAVDLRYKKYRTLLRAHNVQFEEQLEPIKSRTSLIDKEIQQCISRETRLEVEDYFEASYTQGGKPVPINENGQPIYKYLDEEECWFSNITRDDVQVFLRHTLYKQDILHETYWPYWYHF